jgi:hypothetical protein
VTQLRDENDGTKKKSVVIRAQEQREQIEEGLERTSAEFCNGIRQ